MKCVALIIVGSWFLIWISFCMAYEPGTHQRLSNNSAQNSVLTVFLDGSKSNVLDDLGLKGYSDKTQLFPNSQAGKSIDLGPAGPTFLARSPLDIQDLIAAGAALEDEGYRSFCHFYDPIPGHTHPLNFKFLFVNHVASHDNSDWATGIVTGPCSMLGLGDEQQDYSLKSAKQYFYNALTMPDRSGRDQNFGDLFLSIGHALHLLEDMAQPQHVRNDMHCDSLKCWPVGLYNPSRYEQYAYRHYLETNANYVPRFDYVRSFWATGDGQGIAEYTNRNFFSAGTLGAVDDLNAFYPLPILDGGSTEEPVSQVFQEMNRPMPSSIAKACGQPDSCKMKFYSTTGYDLYSHTPVVNQKASTDSLFNADLTNFGGHPLYVLNDINYQEGEKLLFPQIIGYGTGLINHFFRGRLDVQPDPNTKGGYLVINKSSYPMSDGTLTLYYDDSDGNRYPVPDASWSNVSIDPAGGDDAAGYPIQFSAPTDPVPATSGQYMAVFTGKVGSEDGIAAKLFTEVSSNFVYAGWNSSNCRWFESCSSGVNVFDSTFNLHSASPLGLPIYNLVVYDGREYALAGSPNCSYSVLLQGVAIADSTLTWCGNRNSGEVFDIDTLGVNSQYLYIFKSHFTVVNTDAGQRMNYNYESADRYDHEGTYVSTIARLPVGTVGEASVNDTRMCLAARSVDFASSVALLADLDGNTVASFPLTNQSDYVSCALAADRAYVLDDPFEGGDPILNVYDMNGNAQASFTISGIKNYALWGIFAHNSYIYVMVVRTDYSNSSYVTFIHKAVIYDREVTRDSEGNITSESFSRRPDVTIPELPYSYGINFALDMKDVLGALKN